ncbi:amino acid ABC transporter permease, partial [Vibrio sp. 10N.222.49.F1]
MKPNETISPTQEKPQPKSANLFYNPTFRSIVFQILAVAALCAFFYTIVNNVLTNLDS